LRYIALAINKGKIPSSVTPCGRDSIPPKGEAEDSAHPFGGLLHLKVRNDTVFDVGFQRVFNPLAGCRAVLYISWTLKSKALPCAIIAFGDQ
jgi:hypothetical protein